MDNGFVNVSEHHGLVGPHTTQTSSCSNRPGFEMAVQFLLAPGPHVCVNVLLIH